MIFIDKVLEEDQAEVAALAREVIATLPRLSADSGSAVVNEARAILIESGLWSIGISDELGGGGATLDLRQVSLTVLGSSYPALAWAITQADAAANILANDQSLASTQQAVVDGTLPVAVVDLDAPHVDLQVRDGDLTGIIDRLDPSGTDPLVIALGEHSAWVLQPHAISSTEFYDTTGMVGAETMSVVVNAASNGITELTLIEVDEIRARLQIGGAAIAAGLAVAAATASAEYSQGRIQFGGPLTNLATVRQSLAEQRSTSYAALSASLVAEAPTWGRAGGILRDNCERAIAVTADALLSHGGYGYLAEYDIERMVRDAISLRAATGASAAMLRSAAQFAPNH